MSDKKLLGLYCGRPVYDGDEFSTEFKLMIAEGKVINATQADSKLHDAQCVGAGLNCVSEAQSARFFGVFVIVVCVLLVVIL